MNVNASSSSTTEVVVERVSQRHPLVNAIGESNVSDGKLTPMQRELGRYLSRNPCIIDRVNDFIADRAFIVYGIVMCSFCICTYITELVVLEMEVDMNTIGILKTWVVFDAITYFAAALVDPGKPITRMNKLKETDTYCGWCAHWRERRTHHCRFCKRCIPKRDHHCPWIANCVGRRNETNFFLFTLNTAVLSLMGLCFTMYFQFVLKSHAIDLVLLNLNYALLSIGFVFCGHLTVRHAYLLMYNITGRELLEQSEHRGDMPRNPYNEGVLTNLERAFGSRVGLVFWFVPSLSPLWNDMIEMWSNGQRQQQGD